jgi:hypothetical protein
MRSNTASREYFVGLPGLGQTLSKSSMSAALLPEAGKDIID